MFLKLVSSIGEVLKDSKCKFTLLRSACIKADKPSTKISELPSEFIIQLKGTGNFDELLELLTASTYCNWINIRVFERMSACSRQAEAKELIDKYKQIVFSKRLSDILEDIPDLIIPEDFYTKVEDKWNKKIEDITLEDIAKRWANLQKIFDVDDVEVLLKNVINCSIKIVWLIPISLVSHARFSAFKNWYDLKDVSYLSIGDHVIKNDQLEFTEQHISITTGKLTQIAN